MNNLLRVLGTVVGMVASGVILTVAVVWLYSTFLSPGLPTAEYSQFAQTSGPWISVVAGPPITYLWIRLATGSVSAGVAGRIAFWIMGIYLMVDLAVLAGTQASGSVWLFALVSALGRSIAAWLAVRSRSSG